MAKFVLGIACLLCSGLEILAAELAASKVSDDDVRTLQTYLSQMEDRKKDYAAFVEVDMLFHQTLATASGNETLRGLLQSVRSLLRLWVDRSIAQEQEALDAINEHSQLLKALETRDPAAARAAMEAHMSTANRRLLDKEESARHGKTGTDGD